MNYPPPLGKLNTVGSKANWYVAQVVAGQETAVLERCLSQVPAVLLSDVFLPEHEVMHKVAGEWRLRRKLLFPGYIFLVSSDIKGLLGALSGVQGLLRVLGAGQDAATPLPLSDDERDWLAAFMDDTRVVRMSEGVIEGDAVRVTRGPLMGHEARIRKIDRHKRRALVEIEMFGRSVATGVGLEIVRKVA